VTRRATLTFLIADWDRGRARIARPHDAYTFDPGLDRTPQGGSVPADQLQLLSTGVITLHVASAG
jgi:hypothetical protein